MIGASNLPPMSNPNVSFAAAIASALADLGVEDACVSPGSRNAPLIVGFAAEPRIRKWSILDERSAGFFGVGLARTTRKPVALVCTSGTAAAEYHAAVIEASQSDTPLLVLTADRPPELRNVGAPQTIDQIGLYGSSPRLFIDAPVPTEETAGRAGELAQQAWMAATSSPPGPVHLNLPFREPLLSAASFSGNQPHVTLPETEPLTPLDVTDLAKTVAGRRGIIVAGRSGDPEFPAACSALAVAAGYPIFADPLSGLRHGSHQLDLVLGNGDTLAAAGALDRLKPDLVLRLGHVPTSKPTWQWLESHADVEQILVGTDGRDATRSAAVLLTGSTTRLADALAESLPPAGNPRWTQAWRELDDSVGATIESALIDAPFPNEPSIARVVLAAAPPSAVVTVGSSMPVRDIDTYGGKSNRPITIVGNRGTNGIDGVVSSALGSTAAGGPALALVGDVSMFHDLNALGTAAQLDLPITIVVVNNDGGGIFHFLPQNDPSLMQPETFETYLATPHGTDFAAIAEALGIETYNVADRNKLAELISNPAPGPRLIQIRTDRHENLALHRRIAAAVRTRVDRATSPPEDSTAAGT